MCQFPLRLLRISGEALYLPRVLIGLPEHKTGEIVGRVRLCFLFSSLFVVWTDPPLIASVLVASTRACSRVCSGVSFFNGRIVVSVLERSVN